MSDLIGSRVIVFDSWRQPPLRRGTVVEIDKDCAYYWVRMDEDEPGTVTAISRSRMQVLDAIEALAELGR
jgi:hypothetical protein